MTCAWALVVELPYPSKTELISKSSSYQISKIYLKALKINTFISKSSLHNQIVALHLGVITTLHWLHCKPHWGRIMQPFSPPYDQTDVDKVFITPHIQQLMKTGLQATMKFTYLRQLFDCIGHGWITLNITVTCLELLWHDNTTYRFLWVFFCFSG